MRMPELRLPGTAERRTPSRSPCAKTAWCSFKIAPDIIPCHLNIFAFWRNHTAVFDLIIVEIEPPIRCHYVTLVAVSKSREILRRRRQRRARFFSAASCDGEHELRLNTTDRHTSAEQTCLYAAGEANVHGSSRTVPVARPVFVALFFPKFNVTNKCRIFSLTTDATVFYSAWFGQQARCERPAEQRCTLAIDDTRPAVTAYDVNEFSTICGTFWSDILVPG